MEQTTTETARATAAPRAGPCELVVTFLGHATTLIDMDGTRLLTDPVLRTRVGALLRHGPLPGTDATEDLDAVLLSHFHLDHTDIVSLNMLSRETTVIAPAGVRALLRGKHFREILEMTPGDSVRLGSLQITATPAMHEGRRFPWNKPSEALGYSIQGSQKVYFAGDTGLFPELAELAGALDVALLPIWGWGLRLRDDHLSPETAARALELLRPRIAIPIHWGTLLPMGATRSHGHYLLDPPQAFVRHAGTLAPQVEVLVLRMGQWSRISGSAAQP